MTFLILMVLAYLAGCSAAAQLSLWRDDTTVEHTTGDEWDGGLR